MANLLDLPVELIRQICSHLQCFSHYSKRTSSRELVRLSKTCRRMRDIIQPLIFTSFRYRDASRTRLARFLRALHARPDLGQRIRHLDAPPLTEAFKLSTPDRLFVDQMIDRIQHPYPIDVNWHDYPKRFGDLLLTELILLHTPGLTHLRIAVGPNSQVPLVEDRTGTGFLDSLRYLQARCSDSRPRGVIGVPIKVVMSFCAAAPGLEELWVRTPLRNGWEGKVDHLANLTRLEFDGICSIEKDLLKELVQAAPRLEVIRLVWLALDCKTNRERAVTVGDAWEILRLRKETLRDVSLDVWDEGLHAERLELGKLGWWSLRDWPRLRVLKVGELPLKVFQAAWEGAGVRSGFLDQLLPVGIRVLTFWEPDPVIIPLVRELAGAAEWREHPELSKVSVTPLEPSETQILRWYGQSDWERAEVSLRAMFEKGGVEFELPTMIRPRTLGFFDNRILGW
ncbi:hypothetical protein OQA88_8279 [Cercophora sp. LCS_1]